MRMLVAVFSAVMFLAACNTVQGIGKESRFCCRKRRKITRAGRFFVFCPVLWCVCHETGAFAAWRKTNGLI